MGYALAQWLCGRQLDRDTHMNAPKGQNYKEAGVDIDAGNALVKAIAPLARSTARPGADAHLGGFGAIFDLKAVGLRDPVLVAATDGVGTKLRLAIDSKRYDSVGIDLVAMSVNDLIVQGAHPLFFLDYFASAKLDVTVAQQVIAGIAKGCKIAGVALIGGETAEMPGMYADGDYDLAGFAVGAAERDRLLPRADVRPGDIILGLASSGVHSNGYSLVRKILAQRSLSLDLPAPFEKEKSIADILLKPTRIYVESITAALEQISGVKALAHITGGGLTENLPRVMPADMAAEVHLSSFPFSPVFAWLRDEGQIEEEEMLRVFNCGIGMAVIVEPSDAMSLRRVLTEKGEQVFEIGRVIAGRGAPEVRYVGKLGAAGA
jgi:phosphoribosylformylglycinamidine cyclo-ligase